MGYVGGSLGLGPRLRKFDSCYADHFRENRPPQSKINGVNVRGVVFVIDKPQNVSLVQR